MPTTMNHPVDQADPHDAGITVLDRVFPVMGSAAHVLVVVDRDRDGAPGEQLLDAARARLCQLEDLWSRFRPSSEIGRLNRAGGDEVPVSRDTIELLARCVHGWRATTGLFDPTVRDALVRSGSDRSVERPGMVDGAGTAPSCETVEIDRVAGTARLGPGVTIDPGGMSKGLAADLVVAELLAAGAVGAMVNVGGDTVVEGRPPRPSGWQIGIADTRVSHAAGDAEGPDPLCAVVGMTAGAVVTSALHERRWSVGDVSHDHLIDPQTGLPAGDGLQAVTVMSSAGWWAEALAAAAVVAGLDRARELLSAMGATGLAVLADGTVEPFAGLGPYLR